MTRVIRNFSHGNGIRVIYLPEFGIYRKVTFNRWGKRLLQNEAEGLKWYHKILTGVSSTVTLYKSPCYSRLDMPAMPGLKLNYGLGFSQNLACWELVLQHYLTVWPRQKIVPCHGDLTLDNVLVENGRAAIIDWEHFQSKNECWGFDLCYLCLSMIALPHLQGKNISNDDWLCFINSWKKLIALDVNTVIVENPVEYFNGVFRTSPFWKEIVTQSPNKMFPLLLDEKFCSVLLKKLKATTL